MSVTALPPAPNRNDPTNFPILADPFMSALPLFGTECNALQVDVNAKQLAAATSALNASTSEGNALTSANNSAASAAAAASSASATIWVSGTTYAVGDVRFSPINFMSYRRKIAGAGTTDPSLDTTNWQNVTIGVQPYMHVRNEQTSGTSAETLTASAYTTRVLNTVVSNTIIGASLSSNQIILPAGTYEFDAFSPTLQPSGLGMRLSLYNVTDSSTVMLGVSSTSGLTSASIVLSCKGRFTLTGTKSLVIRTWNGSPSSTGQGGLAASVPGEVEVYSSLQIWKLA